MFSSLKLHFGNMLLNKLFLPAPELKMTPERATEFDAQYEILQTITKNEGSAYNCPYPKHEFLRYLVKEKNVLLHGSNHCELEKLIPKRQTDWNGKMMEAVFASGDGIWPMFFATVDHANYRGSLRNGCFVISKEGLPENRYYFFSLNAEYRYKEIWRKGMIYVLPKDTFKKTDRGQIRLDEWASEETIEPIAKLSISPQDFSFLHNVAWHDENETIYLSWLRFKRRQQAMDEV
jgi:hypothetical protein